MRSIRAHVAAALAIGGAVFALFLVTFRWPGLAALDKIMHGAAGFAVAFLAHALLAAGEARGMLRMPPWLRGISALTAALAVGAVWEVAEWTGDIMYFAEHGPYLLQTSHADTMKDLVADGVGGGIAALIAAFHHAPDRTRETE